MTVTPKLNPYRLRAAVAQFFDTIEDSVLLTRLLAQLAELGVDVRPMAEDPEMFVVLLALTEEPLFKIRREYLEDPAGTTEGWSRPGGWTIS